MADVLYISGCLYGIGISFGITLVTAVWYHMARGWGKNDRRHISQKFPYFLAMFNVAYYIVKIFQLNGINNDCGTQESFSVFLYLGSLTILFTFFIIRYWEVYGWNLRLWPVVIAVIIFAISIPVSIASNVTTLTGGACSVYHPPISALMPSITSFFISAAITMMFLEPIFATSKFSLGKRFFYFFLFFFFFLIFIYFFNILPLKLRIDFFFLSPVNHLLSGKHEISWKNSFYHKFLCYGIYCFL